ncbi:MAG: glutamate-1-semialdehyde 2,1-aminomutase [Candidatus Melainabacteria bacterium]|nr:glutamate-1-semialdehyde 2,1-aminomutase [Candidatus Melainabacteria bacterium]
MQETIANKTRSQKLYKKALELISGGVNSPVRSFKAVELEPLFISHASGPCIWDVDQNKYIDYVNSWGALIHGHAHPQIIETVAKVLQKGTSFGAPHENEIELAQIIVQNMPSIEKVRLVNSGTEAVMTAIRLARAYTKRNKIIKFSGCYHGHSDSVLSKSSSGLTTLGIPDSSGVTKSTASDVITLPFNDLHTFEITLNKFPKDIAAVITEPVIGNCGVILPDESFLRLLKSLSGKFNYVLIFDEVITGFRLSLGGAQKIYKITPHLTTLGKIIGGGMPVGAIGGKKEIMDLLAPLGPVYQAGTLSGNPISVACGIATLNLLNEKSYKYLEHITSLLCTGIIEINKEKGIQLQVNQAGSMFSIFFTENKVNNYETAKKSNTKSFAKFFQCMLSNGIYIAPSQFEANFISTLHTELDIEKTLDAYKKNAQNEFQITNNS